MENGNNMAKPNCFSIMMNYENTLSYMRVKIRYTLHYTLKYLKQIKKKSQCSYIQQYNPIRPIKLMKPIKPQRNDDPWSNIYHNLTMSVKAAAICCATLFPKI